MCQIPRKFDINSLHKIFIFYIFFTRIEYQFAIQTSCGSVFLRHELNFSKACQTMQLIGGKKDWKHVSVQKVVTLNICCNVACLTFYLPHITTGSSQSHQCQPTIGSFQSHQRLEERTRAGLWGWGGRRHRRQKQRWYRKTASVAFLMPYNCSKISLHFANLLYLPQRRVQGWARWLSPQTHKLASQISWIVQ